MPAHQTGCIAAAHRAAHDEYRIRTLTISHAELKREAASHRAKFGKAKLELRKAGKDTKTLIRIARRLRFESDEHTSKRRRAQGDPIVRFADEDEVREIPARVKVEEEDEEMIDQPIAGPSNGLTAPRALSHFAREGAPSPIFPSDSA